MNNDEIAARLAALEALAMTLLRTMPKESRAEIARELVKGMIERPESEAHAIRTLVSSIAVLNAAREFSDH